MRPFTILFTTACLFIAGPALGQENIDTQSANPTQTMLIAGSGVQGDSNDGIVQIALGALVTHQAENSRLRWVIGGTMQGLAEPLVPFIVPTLGAEAKVSKVFYLGAHASYSLVPPWSAESFPKTELVPRGPSAQASVNLHKEKDGKYAEIRASGGPGIDTRTGKMYATYLVAVGLPL